MIWHRKATIENAMRIFLEQYAEAKGNKNVQKPISYALYKTWEYFDSIEKPRKEKQNDTQRKTRVPEEVD